MSTEPNYIFYIYKDTSLEREGLEAVLFEEELSKHRLRTGISKEDILKDKKLTAALNENVSIRADSMSYYEWADDEAEGFEYLEEFGIYQRFVEFPSHSLSEVPLPIITEVKTTPSLKSVPEKAEKVLTPPTVKDSYENCFGLINEDAEDFIGGLFRTKEPGKSSIASHIESEDRLTVSRCKELLSFIHPESYNDKQRKQFVGLNYRLSHLGVAPRWRGINRDGHYKFSKRERTPEQEAFLRDVQVFDMEWLHKRYHGHLVDTSWNGAMEGIFTSENFDTKKSAIISEMAITPAKKADYLMLTSDMQKELMMLRTKEVDDLIRGLLDQSKRVHNDLMNCARRNKSKGKKLMENLPVRVDLWLASKLNPGGSIAMLIETYRLITGTQLTKSNCQRLLLSLNDSLKEVKSKYVLN